ncbi:FHA domain-containing protein [Pseudothauera rhizosphaerae]|uniref:FHA domain-containing protein n=1 Tax=Pseudothauera rhizosphaerae TaxID=2565932 RepID=A0A4S4AJ60_9RHOO|nr:FHA domain-containing protein [Pseudothauera rhizosphaerae]THF59396.1 FHA domain-containing protein [Pseudothauera rhizosphaerae]
MTERKNLCILVAEVTGGDRLIGRLTAEEAQHSVDRCLNRIDRVVESNGGERLTREPQGLAASFERCDAAVLAACEMLERVVSLPPTSGVQLSARIGVHYGAIEPTRPPHGEGLTVARHLAANAQPGQALASGAAVMLLSTPARHFAGTEGTRSLTVEGMDWPVYEIGHRISGITPLPPTSKLSQQLRIRHQQDDLVVDEQHPVLLIGREQGNDVVIIDPRASRQHARIERRNGGFFLVDQSSNGSFVAIDGHGERMIKQAEILLNGPGRLGCGFSAGDIERDLVFFDLQ